MNRVVHVNVVEVTDFDSCGHFEQRGDGEWEPDRKTGWRERQLEWSCSTQASRLYYGNVCVKRYRTNWCQRRIYVFVQVTGAESVAAMLSTNCTLTSLNLGWNSLRMDSAVTVAESLRHNHCLTTLGLAYNRFSENASQVRRVGTLSEAVPG